MRFAHADQVQIQSAPCIAKEMPEFGRQTEHVVESMARLEELVLVNDCGSIHKLMIRVGVSSGSAVMGIATNNAAPE
jgi:hypothetical protein